MAREIIGESGGIQFFVGQDTPPAPSTTATMTPRVATSTSNIASPVTAPTTSPSFGVTQPAATPPRTSDLQATATPTMPQPQAPSALTEYTMAATSTLEKERQRVEQEYQRRLADVQKQMKEAEARQAEFVKKQEQTIGQMEPLTQPFRADLERNERERLYITENFEANQKLVRELDTLLTQSNSMMQQLRSSKIPGLAAISQSPRAIQAMQDVSARVGIIEAVMSSRNGQIAQGQNFIDRSINAINADRQDQLNYYKTVYDFYENQRDEEGKKLYQLNQEEKSWINKQIGLLENDLERSQRTADYVKELMINPETAQYMADAGVTLNDSVETIQQKMAKQSRIEVRKQAAKANQKVLFEAGVTSPYANVNGEIQRVADGYAFETPEEFQRMTGMTLAQAQANGMVSDFSAYSILERDQVMTLMKEFPDARITPSDTLETAQDKILGSRIYQKSTRTSGGGGGSLNTTAEVNRYLTALIANNGGVNDENRYLLWDQAAKDIEAEGGNPAEFNKLLWEKFHPEKLEGYKKYVEPQSGAGNSNIDKLIEQALTNQ